MNKFVITINRQFGSMGRPIAKEMAEALNVEYYDRDIIERAAYKLHMDLATADGLEETAEKNNFWNMCFPLGHGQAKKQDALFLEQRKIILNLADGQSCIIVGRCSDYTLRCSKNLIRIFIYAPYKERLRNCVDRLKMSEETARAMIHEVDKARDAYQMKYAHYLPGDFHHCDLLMDSSLIGVEETARYLTELVLKRFSATHIGRS
ncbi:MAG: cytidylate kinase-like family protein [Megasphaera sp.]|jgi:cytidylate kinase|nr:cytidylate kinase-like family protein [Megasphaera sp.]MCH4188524.1 cytidylate kinase-like family protein [Megasphaera sp.]MCH4218365.1 cytidylate kinase-like family protein [Megasphaera sp.]